MGFNVIKCKGITMSEIKVKFTVSKRIAYGGREWFLEVKYPAMDNPWVLWTWAKSPTPEQIRDVKLCFFQSSKIYARYGVQVNHISEDL